MSSSGGLGSGPGGKKCSTANFMRQFRDSATKDLKKLTSVQFMEVWTHYDKDGEFFLFFSSLSFRLMHLSIFLLLDLAVPPSLCLLFSLFSLLFAWEEQRRKRGQSSFVERSREKKKRKAHIRHTSYKDLEPDSNNRRRGTKRKSSIRCSKKERWDEEDWLPTDRLVSVDVRIPFSSYLMCNPWHKLRDKINFPSPFAPKLIPSNHSLSFPLPLHPISILFILSIAISLLLFSLSPSCLAVISNAHSYNNTHMYREWLHRRSRDRQLSSRVRIFGQRDRRQSWGKSCVAIACPYEECNQVNK